jgi:hypothetical protein
LCRIGKLRTNRKPEYFNFLWRDFPCSQDRGALFVWSEEVIGGAAIPDVVDGDRVGHDDDAFAKPVGPQDLLKQVGISWKGGSDYVRLKAIEQSSEVFFEPGKSLEIFVVILLAIEPAVDASPHTRRKINYPKITPPNQFVEQGVGFGKQIVQFYLRPFRGNARKSIANSTCSAVMTFPEARREDQYSFFHSLSGHRNADWETRLTKKRERRFTEAFGV